MKSSSKKIEVLKAFSVTPQKRFIHIARDVGCSYNYVKVLARQQKLPKRKRLISLSQQVSNHLTLDPTWNHRELANLLGCSRSLVTVVATRLLGLQRRPSKEQFGPRIFDLLQENPNWKYRELAEFLGCSKTLVGKVALEFLGVRRHAQRGTGPYRRSRAKTQCGENGTVPHNRTTITQGTIVAAE
jgi:AraC-like DNA-binding protein